jgi:3-oxoacyl-[acyl-carrier protein] reductase
MNVLIVGASKGVGRSVVEILSKKEIINTIYISARTESELQSLKSYVIHNGKFCEYHMVDLGNVSNVEYEFSQFLKDKEIDCLFFNSGYLNSSRLVDMKEVEIDTIYNVNCKSFIATWKACYPHIRKSDKAQVIVSGSMGGFQGSVKFPGLAAYSSSKAALASLVEVLAEEHKEEGIIFNTLSYGAVNTDMLQNAFPDYKCDISASDVAGFVVDFMLGVRLFNGKNLPISITTP